MKKKYFLICLLLIASKGFSQTKSQNTLNLKNLDGYIFNHKLLPPGSDQLNPKYLTKKKSKLRNKVYGDTLHYQDFDGDLNGWKVTDLNNNGNIWEWNTIYRTGGLTGGVPAIGSSTAANGFLSLPSDFYNSPLTNPPATMATFVTSPAIELTHKAASVFIQYQHYLNRCCTSLPTYYLEISSDSINWDSIIVQENLPVNRPNAGFTTPVSTVTYNISRFAANKDTLYIRFRANGNSHYWWMIDDVTIIEGPKSDLELSNPRIRLNTQNYAVNPYYTRIPYDLYSPAIFQGTIFNNGSDSAQNANMKVDVRRLTNLRGAFVNEHLYSQTEFVTDSILPPFPTSETLTEDDLTFSPLVQGLFQAYFEVDSDSTGQIPGQEMDSLIFRTTDSSFSKDVGQFFIGDDVTPANITRGNSVGGNDGDACGTVYTIESRSSSKVIPTSISFYVSADSAVDGITISPSIWGFNENSRTFDSLWLPDDFNNLSGYGLLMFGDDYQVQLSDMNSFLTLPLDTTGFSGLDSGSYVVGWEVLGGSTGNRDVYFSVVNDFSNSRQPFLSSMMSHGSTDEKFYHNPNFTSFQPLIRLNISTLPIQTSVDDINNSKSEIFDVVPNPSTGQIKINITVEQTAIYNLSVTNMLGQIVYTDVLRVNGAHIERIDLSSIGKGLFFLTLENSNEKLQKKIIIQ